MALHTCDTLRWYQRPLYARIAQRESPQNGETVAVKCPIHKKLEMDAMLKPWRSLLPTTPIKPCALEIAAWQLKVVSYKMNSQRTEEYL